MRVRLHALEGFRGPERLRWTTRFSGTYELQLDADSLNLAARFIQVRPVKIRPSIIVVAVLVLALAVFVIATEGLPDYRGLGMGMAVATGLILAGAVWDGFSRLLSGGLELDEALRPCREIALSDIDSVMVDGRDLWLWVRVIEMERTLILRHRRREDAEITQRRLREALALAAGR